MNIFKKHAHSYYEILKPELSIFSAFIPANISQVVGIMSE